MANSKIRIAFIGLSANQGWAPRAHLPYLQKTTKYEIAGVCNSSKESSEAAVKAFELPGSVKAYGSSEELANDSANYDLVVCSVRVDKHFDAVKSVVAKGKQCYVEWPLCKTLKEAEELNRLAQSSGGAKTMVGLQGRNSPNVRKVKELIASGKIGKVLSSNVYTAAGNFGQGDSEAMGNLLNDSKIGANMLSIHFGHMVDWTLYALGEDPRELSAVVSTQRKEPLIKTADGKLIKSKRDTPDQIIVQGYLRDGGVFSIHERGGPRFKDTPGLQWSIYGETGEIRVTNPSPFLHIGSDETVVQVHDHASDEVQTIDWKKSDGWESLSPAAQNVARLYEAFADGRTEDYPDWTHAVARHRLLQKIQESSDKSSSVKL